LSRKRLEGRDNFARRRSGSLDFGTFCGPRWNRRAVIRAAIV